MFIGDNSEILNILLIMVAVGLGWTLLRFLLKLARKIFMLGCVSIVLIGALLILSQVLQGA